MGKYMFLASLAFLSFSLTGCKKAPEVPHFGGRGEADGRPSEGKGGAGADGEDKGGGEAETGETAELRGPSDSSILDASCTMKAAVRGVRQWRRLSNVEIKNTSEAVFGVINGLDFNLVSDIPRKELYDNLMIQPNYVDQSRFKSYQSFAAALSGAIDLNRAVSCYKDGDGCIAKGFVPLAERAWRRPVSASESTAFVALYQNLIKERFTAEQSMRFMIEALAQSESFLYRSELGEKQATGEYRLTSWEVASALSYGLTRRPPDATLLALAKDKKLQDAATIRAQASRILDTAEGKVAMREFGSMWLGSKKIGNVEKASKVWTADMKAAATSEMDDLFMESFYAADKALTNLLGSTSLKSSVADTSIYGNRSENNILIYMQTERRGILGTAGFLASNAIENAPSPVQRGVYILSRFLCMGFEPPTEVPVASAQAAQTNKERFAVYEGCGGDCHKTIDQFGFALENFNVDGIYIDKDAGKAIVTNSSLKIDDKAIVVKSPQEMAAAIARSDQLKECYARHVFRYVYGRIEKVPMAMVGSVREKFAASSVSEADRCEIQAIAKAVKGSKGDMKKGMIDAFANEGFLTRIDSIK